MEAIVSANGLDSLLASVRRQVEGKWKIVGNVADEAAEFGAKTAQSYTASRPGAKTGKAGRIDTGAMVEAIRHKRVSYSLDLVEAHYGFIGTLEDYFKMQTVTGFRHHSQFIAPTFALRDSRGPAEAFARSQLNGRL